ncbi:NADH-quinone oxidoreductase subunit J [Peribacillus sp. SCS-37]|uniref:NADH-quinone oxidoreductase subunit J n=1 Tax=Paraperibacillus esterisolvens TaxID=3115296 RepID=UPI003905DB9E
MSFSGEWIAFFLLSGAALAGGLLLINLSKVVHMVIALVLTFVSIAGLFVLLSAEFAAAVQILIYSGAITIIMLFGIMLTRHDDSSARKSGLLKKGLILAAAAGFGLAMYMGIYNLDIPVQETKLHEDNTRQIGVELFSKHVIPFEVTSVLLLAALIGAIVLAKKDRDEQEGDS